jgi:hypothetical protein
MTYPPGPYGQPAPVPAAPKKRRGGLTAVFIIVPIVLVVLCCGGVAGVAWYQESYVPGKQKSEMVSIVAKLGTPEGFTIAQPYDGSGDRALYSLKCKADKCPVDPIEKLVEWAGRGGIQGVSHDLIAGSFTSRRMCHVRVEIKGYHLRLDIDREADQSSLDPAHDTVYTLDLYISPTDSL